MQWGKWMEQSYPEIFFWLFLVFIRIRWTFCDWTTHEPMFSIQRTPDDKEFIWLATVNHHVPRTSDFFNSRHFTLSVYEVWPIDVSKAETWHTNYWPWLVKITFLFKIRCVGGRKEKKKKTRCTWSLWL